MSKTQSLDWDVPKTQSLRDWVFERLGFWASNKREGLGFWNVPIEGLGFWHFARRNLGLLSDWVFERLGF